MTDPLTPDFPPGYEVSTDTGRIDAARVHTWLSADSYWAKGRSRDKQDSAMAGSLNFGVYDSTACAGSCSPPTTPTVSTRNSASSH